MFPGSYSTISGVSATNKILETVSTPNDEEAWKGRIDEVMNWFIGDDLDMIALYFEQVSKDSLYRLHGQKSLGVILTTTLIV